MLMNNVFFLCFVWTINNIQQEEGIKQCSVWQQQQHQWCQRENRPWRRRHRTCCPGWSSCTCWCSPWSYQVRYHQHWQDLQWRQWPSDGQRELEYTSGSRTRKRFTQQTPRAFAVTSRHSRQILSPSLAALTIISASSYPHHDFSKSLYVFIVTNGTLFFGSLFQLHLDETNEAIGRSVLGDEGAWEKKKVLFHNNQPDHKHMEYHRAGRSKEWQRGERNGTWWPGSPAQPEPPWTSLPSTMTAPPIPLPRARESTGEKGQILSMTRFFLEQP